MILTLRNGTRIRLGDGFVHTWLPDGRRIDALPVHDAGSIALAADLGMSVEAMARSHDPLHSILACALGQCASVSLTAALDHVGWTDLGGREEAAVLAVQSYVHALGLDVEEVAARLGVLGATEFYLLPR